MLINGSSKKKTTTTKNIVFKAVSHGLFGALAWFFRVYFTREGSTWLNGKFSDQTVRVAYECYKLFAVYPFSS